MTAHSDACIKYSRNQEWNGLFCRKDSQSSCLGQGSRRFSGPNTNVLEMSNCTYEMLSKK